MKPSPELKARRAKLLVSLDAARLDALLVSSPANIRYLSGFTGSNALLLVTSGHSWLLTDPRYTIQASQESDCKTTIVNGPLLKKVHPILTRQRIRNLGYEPGHLTVESFHWLVDELPKSTRVKPGGGLVEQLRLIKSRREIEAIRGAVQLNSKALDRALARLKSGWSERRLAAELDHSMLTFGADGPAFETIVASGPRSALPHARPTNAPIKPGQLCLIDMGARYAGYCSDMTRIASLGPVPARWQRLHRAVLEAQLAAVAAVRPGAACGEIDKAARTVLESHKVDTFFVHSTGHGLGLEIHEPPRVARKQPALLAEGMVITIEPGVYLEGKGGIRIEDTVLVTKDGCEVLTPTAKEILVR
ncbi:MAG: aminopeptidase P family protein [Acidimicrobiia bacterium]|nr:aminopeptidase P family protein [Acidimicrobiia bacterium]